LRRPAVTDGKNIWKPWTECFANEGEFGANARAERYIWGALSEMGMINAEMNRRASRINNVSLFMGSSV